MNNILVALAIGIVAGIIDVVPMIIQKLDRYACASAFVHWVALGLIIPFVDWDIQPWLKGMLIAVLSTLPVMIIVFPKDRKAIIPMTLFSSVLGALVGITGAWLIG